MMYIALAVVVFIWIFILFLDIIFKSCMFHPYYRGLSEAGVEIQPFFIAWSITRFNRFLNRMGFYSPLFVKTWFRVGAVITSIIIFPCFFLYMYKLVSLFKTHTSEDFEDSRIIPVIPGYNFPLSHWKLYGCVILVCSIVHEFGHALAASRIEVGIDSFGFAVWFIAPVAFVNLRFEQFRYSSRWEQLTVFCAGIWHNIVLSLSCLLTLKYFVLIVSPLFYVGGGVTVLHVNEESGLSDPVTGFVAGDVIQALGNCTVTDLDSWNNCLQKIEAEPEGFCVPIPYLLKDPDPVFFEDCAKKVNHLYFYVEIDYYKAGVCLHARSAVENYNFCKKSNECDFISLCAHPHLLEFHKFVVIKRHEKQKVLYDGTINELSMNVKVSEFLPRFKSVSPSIAETIKEFLQYLLLFSNGLACLNVLPIFQLDGRYIIENLIHICFHGYLSLQRRRLLVDCITKFGMGVATTLVVVTIYKLFTLYV